MDRKVTMAGSNDPDRSTGIFKPPRESLIDEQIREAQQQGMFDNLPGSGKPLPKDDSYYLAGDHWMGNKILKDAGFVPAWIELRKEIAAERGEVIAALDRYREQARILEPADASLQALEDRYVQLAREINRKIDAHNGQAPAGQALTRFVEDATRRWS